MSEQKKLNIYQKIQKARVELQNKKIKKSGKNNYSNYEYFELGDFLPGVNEVCDNNGLVTIFHFEKDKASLKVIDVDDPSSFIEFETPIEMAAIKGSSVMQQIGGTQTYARRYLYMMAFEIAETDIVDKSEIDVDKGECMKKIDKFHVNILKSLIEETETNLVSFLKFVGIKRLEDIQNKDYGECLRLLNKKKEEFYKKQKKDSEKEKVKVQQEDFEF